MARRHPPEATRRAPHAATTSAPGGVGRRRLSTLPAAALPYACGGRPGARRCAGGAPSRRPLQVVAQQVVRVVQDAVESVASPAVGQAVRAGGEDAGEYDVAGFCQGRPQKGVTRHGAVIVALCEGSPGRPLLPNGGGKGRRRNCVRAGGQPGATKQHLVRHVRGRGAYGRVGERIRLPAARRPPVASRGAAVAAKPAQARKGEYPAARAPRGLCFPCGPLPRRRYAGGVTLQRRPPAGGVHQAVLRAERGTRPAAPPRGQTRRRCDRRRRGRR